MDLCKYSGALGKPGEGVHSARLFGLAIFDVLLTAGAAWLVAARADVSFLVVFFILLLIGILLHEAFCVRTALNTALFHRAVTGVSE